MITAGSVLVAIGSIISFKFVVSAGFRYKAIRVSRRSSNGRLQKVSAPK
jgi:hypothetical protein